MKKELQQLHQVMASVGYDMYIVADVDDHNSEYVADHFRYMTYISGFTGGDGTLLVTPKKSYLWTDGRYFIQAAGQLAGTGIELMKMGQPNVPTIEQFINDNLSKGMTLGVCASFVTAKQGQRLAQLCHDHQANFKAGKDLIAEIWDQRPSLPNGKVFLLADKYAGQSVKTKLKRVRNVMKTNGADVLALASLDDIAWLFNFRGDDIPCWPVCLAYALVSENDCQLFFDLNKAQASDIKKLTGHGITVLPESELATALKKLPAEAIIQYDPNKVNYQIAKALGRRKVVTATDPTVIMKAIKNDTEIANLHQANIYDGLAVTKLMYWLQNDKTNKTEMSVVEKLHELRMQQPLYIEDSFSTIAAFGPNGAMMHYNPATGNNAKIKDGFLLVDSGGQYYTGTTDITRTFVMGKISKEMQEDFTRALSGHLALAKVRFMEGLAGYNLDILARQPMWEAGLDYKCGTGHGVGYLSNVHEGPQGFRYKIVPERTDNASLQINMVTTIEPGIYKEGYYGIRHENDVVCVDAGTTPDGHFLAFEPLTLCPFDRNGIIPEMLPASERTYLNNYHQLVYRQLSPLMNEQEKAWLQKVTAAI